MGQPDPIDTRHRDLRIFCALMTYSGVFWGAGIYSYLGARITCAGVEF